MRVAEVATLRKYCLTKYTVDVKLVCNGVAGLPVVDDLDLAAATQECTVGE